MTIKAWVLLAWTFAVLFAAPAGAEDLSKKYIGKSDCSKLETEITREGIRLDRTQKAYLSKYKLRDAKVLAIVQYRELDDSCGVIQDVTELRDKDSSVVWECVDRRFPSDVVVGTWPAKHPKPRGPAVEAWRIDLKELKFIPVEQAPRFVYCRPQSGAGYDDGLGLSDYAKKRAARHPAK